MEPTLSDIGGEGEAGFCVRRKHHGASSNLPKPRKPNTPNTTSSIPTKPHTLRKSLTTKENGGTNTDKTTRFT
jgi:hypothetical protein